MARIISGGDGGFRDNGAIGRDGRRAAGRGRRPWLPGGRTGVPPSQRTDGNTKFPLSRVTT